MSEIHLQVEIPLDEDGFYDRRCPASACGNYFKVLESDWANSNATRITCPFCGHENDPDQFTTPEQQRFLEEVAHAEAARILQGMLSGFAKKANRGSSRRGLFSISVKTKFAHIPTPIAPEAIASMRLQITCEGCSCTFAVVGAGFFCPLCGQNSANHSFQQALERSRASFEVAQTADTLLDDSDLAANLRMSILENLINNLVTIFQRFGESILPTMPNYTGSTPRNLFQRVADASNAWEKAGGRAFGDILDPHEIKQLNRYFQMRHVIAHRDGFVDQEYIDKTGDRTWKVGQRIVVTPTMAAGMIELVSGLGAGLTKDAQK